MATSLPKTLNLLQTNFQGPQRFSQQIRGESQSPPELVPHKQPCAEAARRKRCFLLLPDTLWPKNPRDPGLQSHFGGDNKPTYKPRRCLPGLHPFMLRNLPLLITATLSLLGLGYRPWEGDLLCSWMQALFECPPCCTPNPPLESFGALLKK